MEKSVDVFSTQTTNTLKQEYRFTLNHFYDKRYISTCMNCDSSAPFVACWDQMDLHTHHRHLHPDYSGSLQNHIQFCFLMMVAKAKSKQSTGDEYKERINTKPPGCSSKPKKALE